MKAFFENKSNYLFLFLFLSFFSKVEAFYDSNLDSSNYNKSIYNSGLKKSTEHWKYESGVSQEVFLQHLQSQVLGITILSEDRSLKAKLNELSSKLFKEKSALAVKSFGCANVSRSIVCEIIYMTYSIDKPTEFVGRAFGFIDFAKNSVYNLKMEFLK